MMKKIWKSWAFTLLSTWLAEILRRRWPFFDIELKEWDKATKKKSEYCHQADDFTAEYLKFYKWTIFHHNHFRFTSISTSNEFPTMMNKIALFWSHFMSTKWIIMETFVHAITNVHSTNFHSQEKAIAWHLKFINLADKWQNKCF